VYRKEEVSVDDENEESMDERNNVRYLRMNWINIITECQVELRIICYRGSSAEIIRNLKDWHWTSTDEYAIAESSRPKEIMIIMGIEDQYVVEWPWGSQQYRKPYFEKSLQLAWYDETNSIQTDRYRYWILLEAIGGPDDIYCGGVFARHTDSKEATVKCKNRSGNPAIKYEYFTRANNAHKKCNICLNVL
jgi:hypothetical protein